MNNDAKEKAKQMYIDGKRISDISKALQISEKTLYVWRDKNGWDEAKKIANLSPDEIKNILTMTVKTVILDIKEHPEKLLTPGVADSLIKYMATIKKLDKDVDYLGVAADVMETITKTVKEEFPEHIEVWQKMARRIYERLEEGKK